MQNVRLIEALTCAVALLVAVAFQNAHAQTDPVGGRSNLISYTGSINASFCRKHGKP
jgi:hypothetical protein